MNVGFINQNISPRLNMGLAYIMTMAQKKEQVFFWDIVGRYQNFSHYVADEIEAVQPRAIGFSVNSYTFRSALYWAHFIKQRFPHIYLIFGGVHPTIRPFECIRNPLVDIICIGEGEYAISECLDRLAAGELPYNVPGIWFKDEAGRIIENPLRSFVENLDELPFPNWDIWDIERYIKVGGLVRNSLKILASRGCYYDCKFCTAPVIRERIPGEYYRVRSAENVIAEIKMLRAKYYARGLRYISFADPLFGANETQFDRLTALYRAEGLAEELPWICETRPEIITAEWTRRAHEAGCMVVSLGIESAEDMVRRHSLGKTIADEQIATAIANLEHNDILYILYLILCAPGESFKTVFKTLKFAAQYNPIKTYFLFFLPLPETPLYEECQSSFLTHRDTKFDDGFWNRPNIRLRGINNLGYVWLRLHMFIMKVVLFFKSG